MRLSATYLSEIAVSKHRGFYSSFQYVTLIGGQVLAALVLLVMQALFTPAQLESWGWRVPFLIGALCATYGFYLRRNLQESAEFLAAAKVRTESPLRGVFRHPRELLLVFGLTMGGTAAFYTFSTYMPTFLANTVKLPREQANQLSFITLFAFAAMQPVLGAISDRVGRKPVLLWFGIMGTLCTVLDHDNDGGDQGLHHLAAVAAVRAADRVRLHQHQRGGEGGAVPGRGAGAWRGAAICRGGERVRRLGALRCLAVQGPGARGRGSSGTSPC